MLDNLLKRTIERRRAARELDAAILAVNSGAEVNGRDVGLLLDAVSNPSNADFGRKVAALRALTRVELPADARARAAEALCQQARSDAGRLDARGRRRRVLRTSGIWVLAAVILICSAVPAFYLPDGPAIVSDAVGLALGALGLIAGLGVVPVTMIRVASEKYKVQYIRAEATVAVGGWKEPDTLWVVFRNLHDSNRLVRLAAIRSLPGILSSVLADEIMPPPGAMEYLMPLLNWWDERLVVMILDVLREYGGGSRAAEVGRLAKRGRTERIRAAAADVLPILLERLRLEQDPRVLLRPSEAPEDGPEVLLRPAVSTADEDPSMLLRAEAGETPEG
jgi:hypothetical protein